MRGSAALVVLGCTAVILGSFPVLINAVAARLPRTSAGQFAAAAAAANLTAPQLRSVHQNKTTTTLPPGPTTSRGQNSRNRWVSKCTRFCIGYSIII